MNEKDVLAIEDNIPSFLFTGLKIEHLDVGNIKIDPDEGSVNELENIDIKCVLDPLKIDSEVKKEDKFLLNLDSKLNIQRSEGNYGSFHEFITKESCEICSVSFNSGSEFDTFVCKHTNKGSLHEDAVTRIEDKPFSCTETSSITMWCHICKKSSCKEHVVENPFQCDVCKQFFSLKSLLDLHMNFHKPRKNRRIRNATEEKQQKQCKICNKEFPRIDRLRRHMSVHSVLNCRFCERSFSRESWLKKHEIKHVNKSLVRKKFTR